MPLVLRQTFPLGRFHATRWNQNPFEDRFGEWPPSPWRLLRALAARWFQYSRETGDEDVAQRDKLLRKLGKEVPQFKLPEASWRGPAVKQYHPTGVAWSDGQAKNPGYKRPGSTLVEDHYRAVPADTPIYWLWNSIELETHERRLLDALLRRMIYFGRSESFCRMVVDETDKPTVNCTLANQSGCGNPVLVPLPDVDIDIAVLLSTTDSSTLKLRRIPPGTAWFYASIPPKRIEARKTAPVPRYPNTVTLLQFAVGGRVLPPLAHWVMLMERFRSAVLRQRSLQVSSGRASRWAELTNDERFQLRLLRGIDPDGTPVAGGETTFHSILPDEGGCPTRLGCWRTTPFTAEEIDALMGACDAPMAWDYGTPEWQVRIVPLPLNTPPLNAFFGESRIWTSSTPFVLPAGRQRFRRNGRQRTGETPQACLQKLLTRFGYPPASVTLTHGTSIADQEWVTVHETEGTRQHRGSERTTRMLPGYRFRVVFDAPIAGPLNLGHSCHFGLGLFSHPRFELSESCNDG